MREAETTAKRPPLALALDLSILACGSARRSAGQPVIGTTTLPALWLFFALLGGAEFSASLKNVSIEVPLAVRVGDSVALKCRYDLEGESLYMVKWYKGRREFYRYVPKELPNIRVFPVPAVNVDVSVSGANRVVLRNVRHDMAGRYRCEVSADAPSFRTQVVAATMHVVHAADGVPNLILEKSRYSIGDTLRGNCTSPPSTPAANITWYINDEQVNATFYDRRKWAPNETRPSGADTTRRSPDLYATEAGLRFELTNELQLRQLRVVCVADLFRTFSTRAQVVLDEPRPTRRTSVGYATADSTSASHCPSTMSWLASDRPAVAVFVAGCCLISSYAAAAAIPS